MVDDHDAPAQRLHVGHVVAGEQDGRPEAAVVLRDKGAYAPLHRHVEADGRLVQEHHAGAVQQGCRDLALHPLAEGEVAHRLVQKRPQFQKLGQLVEHAAVVLGRDAVDGAVQLE